MENTETVLETQKAPLPTAPEDVLDTRTPEEIEAALLKQAEDDATAMAMNRDPAEIAAMCFHLFYPKFSQMLGLLSKKQLRAVLENLIGRGHPSMPEVPTFKEKITGDTYKMGLELMQAKFMMITKLEMDALQEQVDQDEAKKIADEAVIITGDEENA
jgi:hypothetical protein